MSDFLCKCNDISIPPKRIMAIIGDREETTQLVSAMAGLGDRKLYKVQYGDEFGRQLKKEPWKLQFVPDDIVCYRDLSAGDFLKGMCVNYEVSEEDKIALLQEFNINIEEKLLEMTFESNRAVSVAASLLAKPTLLLLDKPYDMVSSTMYKKFVKEIVKTYFAGGSVVITAEKYEDVEVLCSDYIFLKNGKADKHFFGRKALPVGSKIVTLWGCESMPAGMELRPLCKKGDCLRFIYRGGDVKELAMCLERIQCRDFTVEQLRVEEEIYSDYSRWIF